MANLLVYGIFDSKVNAYVDQFFQRTRGEALRSWTTIASDPKHPVSKHPHDYMLFELGEFDNLTGTFKNHQSPQQLGMASQFLPEEGPMPEIGVIHQTKKA